MVALSGVVTGWTKKSSGSGDRYSYSSATPSNSSSFSSLLQSHICTRLTSITPPGAGGPGSPGCRLMKVGLPAGAGPAEAARAAAV